MTSLYGAELAAGAWVERWKIESRAAQGGSSILYRARHTTSGQSAALKVLRAEYGFSASALRRFHQEAALLARVRHPHVVELYGSGELEDGRPWLAMAWVEGSTLAQWLEARGRLEAAEVLPLLEQLCGALEAVHAAGLVHRDLNARNVLVRRGSGPPQVVLVDFGIARSLEPLVGSPDTSTGRVLGTPLALAPEQIRGGTVDARTDLYALGVLLYQLLCGQPPFRSGDVAELMDQHLSAPVPPLAPLAPVPPAVEAVVRRCLEKLPEARFKSAGQVLEALREALQPAAHSVASSRAAALYLELVAAPGASFEALERLDVLWEQALRSLEAGGFSVKTQGAGMILATAPLPALPHPERLERTRLLALARKLGQGLEAARQGEALQVTLTLHVSQASGPELLSPARWALSGPGVHATEAAREGCEHGPDGS
ncbi:serine/threonine-protein kinase [Hyalangium minutum]|uniref:Serine/threonine protein kinase n=1 Tax=Hyalangium minutum TaxID=394096 RepID=A0A085W3V4_9BACT|nr:serine/threonine-protein kinase [Hyalangium minutum]KFE62367.1 Serine/threonine protein kinase [Hyalangium minutum]